MIDGADLVYPIVTWLGASDWKEVVDLCRSWFINAGAKRLSNALGAGVKCIVVEREYIDRDYGWGQGSG